MAVKTGEIRKLLLEELEKSNYSKLAVLCDINTRINCYPIIEDILPDHVLITVPAGEKYKNLDSCAMIWEALTKNEMDRKSLMINLGGGVIGDMGGFCAAAYKRGISFMNVPTTLLSMVDASVGGKLGIDFLGFKNQIGLFSDAQSILIDPIFLNTLAFDELRSGFAEILKHGLIKDRAYWDKAKNLAVSPKELATVIAQSIAIKSEIVEADPKEKGLRKILNFGHTIGHAIEAYYLSSSNPFLHGEAIALGMLAETQLSSELCGLSKDDAKQIRDGIRKIFPELEINKSDIAKITRLTLHDKKNENGRVLMSLLSAIGNCQYDVEVTKEKIKAALKDCLFYN
jgi:3-dehydroquinate synthase